MIKKLSPEQTLAVLAIARTLTRDVVGVAGCVSAVAGVGMIYAPAAYIAAGAACIAWAYLTARRDD